MGFVYEIVTIVLLVFASGALAAAEIAIVYIRPSRVSELVEKRVGGSHEIAFFKKNTENFFSVIQIGITFTGTLASALGGATSVRLVTPILKNSGIGWLSRYGLQFSMAIVVVAVAFVFLVFGELVPKSLAMRYPETISLWMARPLKVMSDVFKPVVWVLTRLQRGILGLIPGGSLPKAEAALTERELKIIIDEGRRAGAIGTTERDLMHAVFDFADRSVGEVMVPRSKMVSIPSDMAEEMVKRVLIEEGYSRYPVTGRDLDDVRGVIYAKDVLYMEFEKELISLPDIIRPAVFTSTDTPVSKLMKEMQKGHYQLAIVKGPTGRVEGLITLEDILEEIVGEIE